MQSNDIYAAENMYDAWDNGDRYEIRKQIAQREADRRKLEEEKAALSEAPSDVG